MINKEYNEYCLINRDKKECVEYLIENNKGLVYSKVNNYFSNSPIISCDDLSQAGLIGLWKAIKSYNFEKNTTFATYASRCIDNEIRMLLRVQKKYDKFKMYSLSYVCNTKNAESNTTLEEMLCDYKADEGFRNIEIIQLMDKKLCFSEIEKQIINLKLDNKNQQEIANILGYSQSYVSRILKRCEKKLLQVLKG